MSAGNVRVPVPSNPNTVVVRVDVDNGRWYAVHTGHGQHALLSAADVEALYADSIAADGGAPPSDSWQRCRRCRDWASLCAHGMCGNCQAIDPCRPVRP